VNQLALLFFALLFVALAVAFRRTLAQVERPVAVLEKPPLPKGLSELVVRLEKWRAEGRITREEYERFMHLCHEDSGLAGRETPPSPEGGRPT
jgi:hypothetical protein